MSGLRLLSSADADLDEQFDYLLVHAGAAVAMRFADAFWTTTRRAQESPRSGVPRATENPRLQGLRSIRLVGFDSHILFYLDREEVVAVRLLHGARDIGAIIADEPAEGL